LKARIAELEDAFQRFDSVLSGGELAP
jgi:hypothetical protein